MGFFAKKETKFLGIDIGSASVKIIELENHKGEARLVNYGFAEKLKKIESSRTEDIISRSAEIIKQIHEASGFSTKSVIAALHNFDVFTSVINLPARRESEIENIIKVEARKFVPIPLEEVVLDWKNLEPKDDGKKFTPSVGLKKTPAPVPEHEGEHDDSLQDLNGDASKAHDTTKALEPKKKPLHEEVLSTEKENSLDVLLTAAPRKLVKKYVDIFRSAELNLLSLETESFAFIRALLDPHDATSAMIIDIGAVATDIIIVEQHVPVIIRSVDVGGASITNAIEQNLGISAERAEQFKRDIGLLEKSKDQNTESIFQMIESAFAPVVNEMNYSLDLYKARNRSIEKIVLSGGSAYLTGLVEFLKETFHVPVYVGDPWHRVSYPETLKPELEKIGPMFTVAIGLALKEIFEK